jgi:outer membrane protein OmpA-like peptidoglycan-associated protein
MCPALVAMFAVLLLAGCAGQAQRRGAAPQSPPQPPAPAAHAAAQGGLAGRLSAALPGFPVEAVDGALRAVLPAERVFDADAVSLRVAGGLDLAPLARLLRSCHGCAAGIVVYTDAIGPAAANRQFSAARAAALLAALQREGVPAARLEGRGAGEDEPVAGQDTPAGRRANRRIEITIRP